MIWITIILVGMAGGFGFIGAAFLVWAGFPARNRFDFEFRSATGIGFWKCALGFLIAGYLVGRMTGLWN